MKILSPTEVFGLKLNRTAVNDTDYHVNQTDVLVGWDALTAPRNCYLPGNLANYDGDEIIWFVDDKGLCSATNYVTIIPNGTDKIGGEDSLLLNHPFEAVCLKNGGAIGWSIIAINSSVMNSPDIAAALGYVPTNPANPVFTGTVVCPELFVTGMTKQKVDIVTTTTSLSGNQSIVIVNSPTACDINLIPGEENAVYRIRSIGDGVATIKPVGGDTIEFVSSYPLAKLNAVSLVYTTGNWYVF